MKNFGKIFGISLFCLSPFFYTQTNAAAMARSGVDLNKSTIAINFAADAGADNATGFSCFGETSSPVNKTLKEIGGFNGDSHDINRSATAVDIISNINNTNTGPNSNLDDCFKAAGTYAIAVDLQDAVGNHSDADSLTSGDQPYTFNFIIKPGNVTQIESEKINIAGSNCNNPHANGIDFCGISTSLKDYAGNQVHQIGFGHSATRNITVTNDTLPNTFSTNFYGGLLLKNGTSGNPGTFLSGATTNSFSSDGNDRVELRALVPSLASDGLMPEEKNIRITYSNIPSINKDGTVNTQAPISGSIFTSEGLTFEKPVTVPITHQLGFLDPAPADGNDDFQLSRDFNDLDNNDANFKDGTQRLKLAVTPNFEKNIHTNPTINTQIVSDNSIDYTRQTALNTTQDIENISLNFSGTTPGVPNNVGSSVSDLPNFFTIASNAYEFITNFFPANGAEGLTPNFDLKSLVNYDININGTSKTIEYYAGSLQQAAGDALGVLIESNVITRDSDTKILANDLAVLTGLAKKDVRETITRNAFALEREARATFTNTPNIAQLTSAFNAEDVVVVKGSNVSISGALPSEKKTLVIINGNLIITGDTYYGDEENDSFGVILINSNSEIQPNTGNIFINNNVQNVRGTFFADGGILPTSDNNDSFDVNDLDSDKQLRIVGSILTRNTIGGAGKAGAETALQTPWGDTTSIDEAKQYDLLYTRDAIATPDNCTHATNYNSTTVGPCNDGTNEKAYSFILRFDRKVLEQSPPGFTTTQSVQQ